MDNIRGQIKERLEKLKKKIDPKIFNNPVFEIEACRACQWIQEASGQDHYYDFKVSEDGKKVIISEKYANKSGREEVSNNQELNVTEFKLSQQQGMESCLVVDRSVGTTYNVSDYTRIFDNQKEKDNFMQKCGRCGVVLSTYYEQSQYDESGIQLSYSTFSDLYPLDESNIRFTNLEEQTLTRLHKPEMSYSLLPQAPMFVMDASSSHAFRTYDNLGICTVTSSNGISGNRNAFPKKSTTNWYSVNTEYPERLSTTPIPLGHFERGEFIGNDSVKITDSSREAVYKDYALAFERGLETSRTKEYNPPMYEALKGIVSGANAKYKSGSMGGDPTDYGGGKK